MTPQDEHPWEAPLRAIAPYSKRDLLTSIAALQLLPENSWTTLRLETLARLAASNEHTDVGNVTLTRQRLVRLVRSDWLDALGILEDPPETPFTSSISFDGGSYVVFPGNYPEVVFTAQHLIKAIFRSTPDFPDPDFYRDAYSLTRRALRTSDRVAAAAGLERGVPPGSVREDILVPSREKLQALAGALLLEQESQSANTRSVLAPLVSRPGQFSVDDSIGETTGLLLHPLVQIDDSLMLTSPGSLLSAYVHALLLLAKGRGVDADLVNYLGLSHWDSATRYMTMLGNRLVDDHIVDDTDLPRGSHEGVFRSDVDKATYVLLVGDELADYEADCLNDWSLGQLTDRAMEHVARFVQLFRHRSHDQQLLCLVVVQGVGRVGFATYSMEPIEGVHALLQMSVADLECIAHLEHGDPLALWKLAEAQLRTRSKVRIVNLSGTLNEFAAYREGHHQLLRPEWPPDADVLIPPGGGLSARMEYEGLFDPHASPSWDDEHVEEVVRQHLFGDIPLYRRREAEDSRSAIMVSGYALPIWVVGSEPEGPLQANATSELVDTLGYWIWQFTPSLASHVAEIASYRSSLAICLLTAGEDEWTRVMEGGSQQDVELVEASSPDPGVITLTVSANIAVQDRASDNFADRLLMRHLLTALWDHLRRLGADVEDSHIEELLDLHAPLGPKKKLFFVRDRDAAVLHDLRLPRVRPLQEADVSHVEEWIGDLLLSSGRYEVGPVIGEERHNLVNHLVGALFQELRRMVLQCRGEGLLETLIARNEALIRDKRFADVTLATEMFCYRAEPDMVQKRIADLESLTSSSIASRFLIEYVAARPPRGNAVLSLADWDLLLATAAKSHSLGRLSDWLKYLKAEVDMAVAPSGRLTEQWGREGDGMDRFVEAQATQELHRAIGAFAEPADRESTIDPEFLDRLDRATRAEFGFSTDEMGRFVRAALPPEDDTAGVICLDADQFVAQTAGEAGLTERQTRKLLDLLSLRRRRSYLGPANPFTAADVYPWLFNRELSYIRRPFVLRPNDDGGSEVLYGPRNLLQAWMNLGGLMLNGRLPHTSKEMERFIQIEVKKASGDFVRAVSDQFSTIDGSIIRTNVSRIQGTSEPLRPHGDIDVLVGTPRGRLLVCECKCVGQGRTPRELRNEVNAFLRAEKGYVAKHLRRVAWATRESEAVGDWLGMQRKVRSVQGVIVVDTELLVAYLGRSALPIISLDALRAEMCERGTVVGQSF